MAAPGYGASKGAAYERTLAVLLSMWLTDGEREDVLWRTAMSGGRATVARRKGRSAESQAGDLQPTDSVGDWFCSTFLIEAKRYKAFDWARDITEARSARPAKATQRILEIVMHTVDEAERAGRKAPLCFLRADRKPDIILTDHRGWDILKAGGTTNMPEPEISWPFRNIVGWRLDSVIPRVSYAAIEAFWTK